MRCARSSGWSSGSWIGSCSVSCVGRAGLGANPFAHFPRLIVSIDWLKGELGMRLLREVLPPHPEIPRRYDVLIVDEVHNCAPAGAGGRYASDTLRTQAIRTLAPHCEHRLFLSATPHNGYANSFAALLELLDPHRFARGIEPSREATREVTVRRLKQDLLNDDGTPRFPRRKVVMLEVEHPESEREVHAQLVAYGGRPRGPARQQSVRARGGGFRHDAAQEASVLLAGGVSAHAGGAPGDAAPGTSAGGAADPDGAAAAVRRCRRLARRRGERGRRRRGRARGDRRGRGGGAEPPDRANELALLRRDDRLG